MRKELEESQMLRIEINHRPH